MAVESKRPSESCNGTFTVPTVWWKISVSLVFLRVVQYVVISHFGTSLGSFTASGPRANKLDASNNKILFLIFAGGPSGYADMNAILDTWGNRVDLALVMSNTPTELPLERIDARNSSSTSASWEVRYAATLDGGKERTSEPFWREALSLVQEQFRKHPGVQWIVRSDSDTWWNIPYLKHLLLEEIILPANDSAVLGQCYGLKDGEWSWEYSHPVTVDRDDGTNCCLTGGSGLVFARAAVDAMSSCLLVGNSTRNIWDISPRQKCWGGRKAEDVWMSCMARECGYSLIGHPAMFQKPTQFKEYMERNGTIARTVSIHRAVGDGRNGWKHPSFFEQMLLQNG